MSIKAILIAILAACFMIGCVAGADCCGYIDDVHYQLGDSSDDVVGPEEPESDPDVSDMAISILGLLLLLVVFLSVGLSAN